MSKLIEEEGALGKRRPRHLRDRKADARAAIEAREGALQSLAEQINGRVSKAETDFVSARTFAFQHAIEVGRLLKEAKALVGSGHWGKWVKKNIRLSSRTVQEYLRVATAIEEGVVDAQHAADSSIRQIIALARARKAGLCGKASLDAMPGGYSQTTSARVERTVADLEQSARHLAEQCAESRGAAGEGPFLEPADPEALRVRLKALILDLWLLVRMCRPAESVTPEKLAREPAALRLPPAPYDRLMRRQCAINNQGSRRRRFSMWPPRWQYYANHRSNRLAARMGQTKKCLFCATNRGSATYTELVAERSPLPRAAVSAPWATTSPAHRETATALQ